MLIFKRLARARDEWLVGRRLGGPRLRQEKRLFTHLDVESLRTDLMTTVQLH